MTVDRRAALRSPWFHFGTDYYSRRPISIRQRCGGYCGDLEFDATVLSYRNIRDVIGHLTIRFAIGHFLLVVLWKQASISNRFQDSAPQSGPNLMCSQTQCWLVIAHAWYHVLCTPVKYFNSSPPICLLGSDEDYGVFSVGECEIERNSQSQIFLQNLTF